MRFLSSATTNGVTERDFVHDGVPGVLWTPAGADSPTPLVLGAHGGGQHKRAPRPAEHAARCVAAGLAVVTLDAPGHGDRPRSAEDERFITEIRSRAAAGPAGPMGQTGQDVAVVIAEYNALLAERAVPEWRSVLDAVLELPEICSETGGGETAGGADGGRGNGSDGGADDGSGAGMDRGSRGGSGENGSGAGAESGGETEAETGANDGGRVNGDGGVNGRGRVNGGGGGQVGFWGMSMGSAIGIPLVAAEPRVRAAVFGLVGRTEGLARAAAEVTVPVRFLLQWDDRLVACEAGLAMFDAFGSSGKTLHANPGGHGDVPAFETDSAVAFLSSRLLVRTPALRLPAGGG